MNERDENCIRSIKELVAFCKEQKETEGCGTCMLSNKIPCSITTLSRSALDGIEFKAKSKV